MKRFAFLAAACAVLIPSLAFSQQVSLDLKGEAVAVVQVEKVVTTIVKEDRTVINRFPVTVNAPANVGLYFWSVPAGVVSIDKGDSLEITAAPKGPLTVSVKSISASVDKDGKFLGFKTTFGTLTVDVGAVTPPDVIPSDGARVLITFEKTTGGAVLTKEQKLELNSKEFADYLNAACIKENGQPSWRLWDKDIKGLENAPQWWRDAMARPRTEDRWLIVTNGVRSHSGPLPDGGKILDKIKAVLEAK